MDGCASVDVGCCALSLTASLRGYDGIPFGAAEIVEGGVAAIYVCSLMVSICDDG